MDATIILNASVLCHRSQGTCVGATSLEPGLFMAFGQEIIVGMGFFCHADRFKMFLSFKVKFDIQHTMHCNETDL